jgi:hypothetical protein
VQTLATILRAPWRTAVVIHFLLSAAAFWLIVIAGIGSGESNQGAAEAWLTALEKVVNFGLLQPLGYWVLVLAPVRYWTWTGFVLTMALLALNSLAAIGICRVVWGRMVARRLVPRD